MSINWVMVPEDRSKPFVPLPRERVLLTTTWARIGLSLKTPKQPSVAAATPPPPPQQQQQPVDIKSGDGVAYLTSARLVYLPSQPTATFKSFSCPLLRLQGVRVEAPIFGPNVLVAGVQPVRDGGLPPVRHAPYLLELRLTFKDGGAYDFPSRLGELRERMAQLREARRDAGGHPGSSSASAEIHAEQLPAYDGPLAAATTAAAPQPNAVPHTAPAQEQSQLQTQLPTRQGQDGAQQLPSSTSLGAASRPPDDLPPAYEEIAGS